ncbi:hypothetical protein BLA29_001883 [Euroglyphus maynei]|uniref:Uncharacterized protein n=1 Tax=Euroglyphus maynei TaxID=6958 RepID=A0A1Y3BCI5_EURMA|nr:hypothetical protein BLA29_001883 [Euroglyphus maynei]
MYSPSSSSLYRRYHPESYESTSVMGNYQSNCYYPRQQPHHYYYNNNNAETETNRHYCHVERKYPLNYSSSTASLSSSSSGYSGSSVSASSLSKSYLTTNPDYNRKGEDTNLQLARAYTSKATLGSSCTNFLSRFTSKLCLNDSTTKADDGDERYMRYRYGNHHHAHSYRQQHSIRINNGTTVRSHLPPVYPSTNDNPHLSITGRDSKYRTKAKLSYSSSSYDYNNYNNLSRAVAATSSYTPTNRYHFRQPFSVQTSNGSPSSLKQSRFTTFLNDNNNQRCYPLRYKSTTSGLYVNGLTMYTPSMYRGGHKESSSKVNKFSTTAKTTITPYKFRS